jgi:hypothetical protein
VTLIFNISSELLFVSGVRRVVHRLVDFSLSELEISAKVGDLGAKNVGRAVKPGNVDRDNGVDVGKRTGHFSDFFEDNMVR